MSGLLFYKKRAMSVSSLICCFVSLRWYRLACVKFMLNLIFDGDSLMYVYVDCSCSLR